MELTPPYLNIDELARTDPLWRKVLEQEANTPQIKLFSFIGRITDARVFVADTLALYKTNSERMVAGKMRGVPELVSNPEFWQTSKGAATEPLPETVQLLVGEMEKATREKIEKHYPQWVLNQALVTYCTILDSFLDSALEAILMQNPKILYGVSGAKNIELKKVVELGSVDAVVCEIRAREIKNFSHEDIADRLNYFGLKLSIETDQLFDWQYSDKDTDRRLEGLNLKTLEANYHKRHDIVHQDKSPISTYEELDIVADFFLAIASKLAILIRQKHQVLWDIHMIMSRNERYSLFK